MARVLRAKSKDFDGFGVKRILPNRNRRMVRPFIFFDHMGPTAFSQAEH